jgi:hypothetical protein
MAFPIPFKLTIVYKNNSVINNYNINVNSNDSSIGATDQFKENYDQAIVEGQETITGTAISSPWDMTDVHVLQLESEAQPFGELHIAIKQTIDNRRIGELNGLGFFVDHGKFPVLVDGSITGTSFELTILFWKSKSERRIVLKGRIKEDGILFGYGQDSIGNKVKFISKNVRA